MSNSIKNLRLSFIICPIIMLVCLILLIVGIAILSIGLVIATVIIIMICIGIMAYDFFSHDSTWTKGTVNNNAKLILDVIGDKKCIELLAIADSLKMSESDARSLVFDGIRDGSLSGWTLKGNKLVLKDHIEESEKKVQDVTVITCSGCGATYTLEESGHTCPFCGKVN